MNRREFIKTSAVASLYPFLGACDDGVRWEQSAYVKPKSSRVAVMAASSYGKGLRDTILRGIKLFGLDVTDKRVLLKPNLVEFDPKAVINTHPAVVEAAIDSFKSLGAKEVIVAEGPGPRRDNESLFTASGLYDVVRDHRVKYVDLNTDEVRLINLKSSFTNLKQLYLP